MNSYCSIKTNKHVPNMYKTRSSQWSMYPNSLSPTTSWEGKSKYTHTHTYVYVFVYVYRNKSLFSSQGNGKCLYQTAVTQS